MEKQFIKIDRWYFPLQGIAFHAFGDTVEIFPVNSTKLIFSYEGEQGKRLKDWLDQRAEDITVVNMTKPE